MTVVVAAFYLVFACLLAIGFAKMFLGRFDVKAPLLIVGATGFLRFRHYIVLEVAIAGAVLLSIIALILTFRAHPEEEESTRSE